MTVRRNDTDPQRAIRETGWAVMPAVAEPPFVSRLNDALAAMYAKRRAVQRRNGIADGMAGTCHHLLGDGNALDEFVARLPLDGLLRWFFDGSYILNSFGGFTNVAENAGGYIGRIHRDIRSFASDFRLMINLLVMLDDFTEENGATLMLPGSHRQAEKPDEAAFLAGAVPALGRAGDVLVFDSRTWHRAGTNRTGAPRRALTLTYTRPFFKQQLDYPRYLGDAYGDGVAPAVRKVLGYDARQPATIEEFYQPPERRAYKPDQG